jgi:hypothetical protein
MPFRRALPLIWENLVLEELIEFDGMNLFGKEKMLRSATPLLLGIGTTQLFLLINS